MPPPSSGHDATVGRVLASLIERCAASRTLPLFILLALCLAVYLPGVLRLPAVDRTEIVFADTTREMVARGAWADPRYGDQVHQFRPIGTFWAQGVVATLGGPEHARDITVYRLPSLAAVSLAVLAVFWLAAPRVGRSTALIAAGLFGVAPLVVLVSQLAIADGLALLPATVAMLCLLRLYDPEPGAPIDRLGLVFWLAMGSGMLVNALHTPILVAVTLIALFMFDRDLSWLRRTRSLIGVPAALLLAAPWLYVRHLQDGVPFAGMGWHEFLAALGGAQDMKLRAFPGTFTAAALLGFLPGVALLPPAMKALWDERGTSRLARFLLAWIAGYIVYLELLSSKPGTYTVQVMFPAMALAVAMLVMRIGETRTKWALVPWLPLAALFALALFGTVYGFVREWPSPLAVVLIAATAALFAWSAHLGRRDDLAGWAVSGIAALALFAITLLGVVFPGVRGIWPAREIASIVHASCGPDRSSAVLGLREPSAAFVLGQPKSGFAPLTVPREPGSLHVVESRWLERYRDAATDRSFAPREIGCVEVFNTMRGCALTFSLFVVDAELRGCTADPKYACRLTKTQLRPSSKACD